MYVHAKNESVMSNSVGLHEWWPWYDKIIKELGYDPNKDQFAADILSRLISKRTIKLQNLKDSIFGRPVLLFGAGPSLEEDLQQLLKKDLFNKFLIVSADGATSALLKIAKITPNIIVSDLDGNIQDLLRANKLGSIMVIHGHGDNIPRLKRYIPRFRNIVGTTQIEPRLNVYNFGGFTDGDRAAFLMVGMGARCVILVGMDLGQAIGKYSKRKVRSIHTKILKLEICKDLLEWLVSKVDTPFYNITNHGDEIKGISRISSLELARLVI